MEIIKLPCDHCFIPEAIEKWVKEEKAICPVCRYTLDSKEVEDKSIITPRSKIFFNQEDEWKFLQSIRRASRLPLIAHLNWARPSITLQNEEIEEMEIEAEAETTTDSTIEAEIETTTEAETDTTTEAETDTST